MKKFISKPHGLLAIFAGACLLLACLAALVNCSFFKVSITKVTADMDAHYTEKYGEAKAKPVRMTIGANKDGMVNGKLTGYVYMPKGVSKDNPAPCIVLTHGYLNSKEFEEAPAIEMSKRGYVVFAFDQYDHGDSTWDTPSAFNFYVWSVYDAVEYMYAQDYVLKDKDGNGMIAVSGHSMGGFGSEIAAAWDEMNVTVYKATTYRMISAVLAVGADFRYDDSYVKAYSGGLYPQTFMAYGTRSAGTIAGEYDEFFFDNSGSGKGTVIKKNYVKDATGKALLGNPKDAQTATWYYVDAATNTAYATKEEAVAAGNYGQRIIYQPKGDHPYNTWSPEATKYMIEFYEEAFTTQLALHGLNALNTYGIKTGSKAQSWWLKEVFTCLGLFALVGVLITAALSLAKLPFFNKAVAEEAAVEENSKPRKTIGRIVTCVSILLSGWLIVPFMDKVAADLELVVNLCKAVLWIVCIVGVVSYLAYTVLKAKGEAEKALPGLQKAAEGSAWIALVAVVLKWVATSGTKLIGGSTNAYWGAPSVNTIVYWAVGSGLLTLLVALISHFAINKGRTSANLGLKVNLKQVGIGLLIAIASCVAAWVVLLIVGIFKVDFRVYTYAFNDVTWVQFKTALKYIPLFFVFYLCAGIAVANQTAGMKGLKGYVVAAVTQTLPCALWLAYQYGTLLTTGTGAYPNFALNGILVQGLIFTLIFLAVIQKAILNKTNNLWIGVFINTIWFTMITVASTAIYLLTF